MVVNIIIEIIILIIGIILIISQSIYNFTDQYKQHIAIRKLNGYSFLNLYNEYFIIIALSFIAEFIVVLVFRWVSIINLLYIISIVIVLELLISTLVLFTKGKINIIKHNRIIRKDR